DLRLDDGGHSASEARHGALLRNSLRENQSLPHGRLRSAIAVIPVILLLVVLGVREYERGGAFSLDTIQLLDGVAATDACLHHGELRCRRGVNYWPPLQSLPGSALTRVRAPCAGPGRVLVY